MSGLPTATKAMFPRTMVFTCSLVLVRSLTRREMPSAMAAAVDDEEEPCGLPCGVSGLDGAACGGAGRRAGAAHPPRTPARNAPASKVAARGVTYGPSFAGNLPPLVSVLLPHVSVGKLGRLTMSANAL